MEIAIKVCRQASPEDALLLAQKHGKHEWYLRIQIEDKREYKKALEYMATLEFEEVLLYLHMYYIYTCVCVYISIKVDTHLY